MPRGVCITAILFVGLIGCLAAAGNQSQISTKYKALDYPIPSSRGTWAILDRDGAGRQVDPYLSSLGGGELGTGLFVSPDFPITVDEISFTVCGHDGQGGGQAKNFIALVDADSDELLQTTMAPCNDAVQQRSWDVKQLVGRRVRVEVHDEIAEGAFAWIGVGRIEAGQALSVDFSEGMPGDWLVRGRLAEDRTELVAGGVPFLRRANVYSIIPDKGIAEIPCGSPAQRLFFLGCTIAGSRPLEVCGYIEIVYRSGPPERYPLMNGYTLDRELKLLSKSKAIHLHPSGDPFQHYLVIAPRPEVIQSIRLRRNPECQAVPRITAITVETEATGDNLRDLPDCEPDAEEEAWIRSHAISVSQPEMADIVSEIRRAHKMTRERP